MAAAGQQLSTDHRGKDVLEDQQQALATGMRASNTKLQQTTKQVMSADDSAWHTQQQSKVAEGKKKILAGNIDMKLINMKLLQEELDELHTRLMTGMEDVQVQTKNLRESTARLKKLEAQRDQVLKELAEGKAKAVDRTRPDTPRPDWHEAAASLAKMLTIDPENGSSHDSSTLLSTHIDDIAQRTQEAHDDLLLHGQQDAMEEERQQVLRTAAEAGAHKKYLMCLGRGASVPSYLRASGKVKNKNLNRGTVVQFLEEFWAAKAKGDRSRKEQIVPFLENYLTLKYGTGRSKVEWTYNLMFAFKRYSYDPDCQSFLSILSGEIPEAVYFNEKQMISDLTAAWVKSDTENHGGRTWGTLERAEFLKTMEDFFKLKTEEEKKSLRRALAQEQPGSDIRYKDLLEPVEGLPGKFLETLREQFVQEVLEAYMLVESAIRRAVMEHTVASQTILPIEPNQCYSYLDLVKGVKVFEEANMTDTQLLELIGQMTIIEVHEGDVIVHEGAPAENAFILEEGVAYSTREGKVGEDMVYRVGDLFGELGLLQNDVRVMSVIARASKRGKCRCLRISKAVFQKVQPGARRLVSLALRLARCPHALNLRFVTPPAQLRAFTSMYPPAHLSVLPGPFFSCLIDWSSCLFPSDIGSLV